MLRSIDSATLTAYLRERRWFGEKSQQSLDARIVDVIPVAGDGQQWAIARVEVTLDDGSVASYQLPLSVREREMSRAHAPAAVLAHVESSVVKGLLVHCRRVSTLPARAQPFERSASCAAGRG